MDAWSHGSEVRARATTASTAEVASGRIRTQSLVQMKSSKWPGVELNARPELSFRSLV
jgi:hypothetical protein